MAPEFQTPQYPYRHSSGRDQGRRDDGERSGLLAADAMSALILTSNLAAPDDFCAALLALHDGRTKNESDAINARLILLLGNHIGDHVVLREAFAATAPLRGGETRMQGGVG